MLWQAAAFQTKKPGNKRELQDKNRDDKIVSMVGNDSCDHVGTMDGALTHYVYPDMIINKDFVQVCGRCRGVFSDFVQFLCHLTKRYDSIHQKECWSCPIVFEVKQGIQAQKVIDYL